MVTVRLMTPQQIDYMSLNFYQMHTRYKIIQKLTYKFFLLENQFSRHNIFALCKEKTNWYWKQQPLQHTIIFPTRIIRNPRLEVIILRYVQDIPKKLCGRDEAKKSIQIHPIIMTDADYDYILDKIELREQLSLEGM